MPQCKICQKNVKHDLASHIRNSHHILSNEYLTKYPNEILYSEEFLKQRIDVRKKLWQNKNTRKKLLAARKIQFTSEVCLKISKTLKNGYKTNKIKVWNSGLTKYNNSTIKEIGEKTKKRITGSKNAKHSEYMKKHSNFVTHNPSKYSIGEKRKLWRERISKTLCERIAKGELNYATHRYKNGYHVGKFNTEYYQSGLELEIMKFLDNCSYVSYWTKKHKRRVQYFADGIKRFYYPDFFITLITGKEIIVESKGRLDENDKIKHEFATDFFSSFFVIFSVIQLQIIIKANCDIEYLSSLIGTSKHGYIIDKIPNNVDRQNQINEYVELILVDKLE